MSEGRRPDMDTDLIDISGEDDSWLLQKIPTEGVSLLAGSSAGCSGNEHFACSPLQIPRSNYSVPARPPFSSVEGVMGDKNLEQPSPLSVRDSGNKENISGNKVEMPKLSVERQQMKRKKKAAGYNLRKSLAWNKAFFTEEGVLDSVELSMITGNDCQTGGEMLPAIEEEGMESISALDSSSSPGLRALEENLFKELPANSKNKEKKVVAGVLPKHASPSKALPTYASPSKVLSLNASPSKVPFSLAKKKVLPAQDTRSGSKRSGCPRPLASSSPANAHTVRAQDKGLKVSKFPASRPDSLIPANTAKMSTQGPSKAKQIQHARTSSFQRTFGFASSSNKISSAQTKEKSSLAGKSSIPKPSVKQARRHAISSASEIPPASNSQHCVVVKAGDGPVAKSHLAFPVSSNDHHIDSSKTAVSVPHSSCSSTGNVQSAIPRVPRPSGLRMPSPSVGFFTQSKIPSSHGSLGKGGQACNISTSGISYSVNHRSLIPTGKKSQVTGKIAEVVNAKATPGNISILGSTTGFSVPSRPSPSAQEKKQVDLKVTLRTESKVPSNPIRTQFTPCLQLPCMIQEDGEKRSRESAAPHKFEEISAEKGKELLINDLKLSLCSKSNEQEKETCDDKRGEKSKSCTLEEDQSSAGELKIGPIFRSSMDTHVQDSCDVELKPFDDYSQTKVSAQMEGNSCTLIEDQSGAGELKHGPIFKDSMDTHSQDSYDDKLKPTDDYTQTKVSAQVEGNSRTLEEDQSGAGELKHGLDPMDTHVQDSRDEELKPFDDYSQTKVSAQVEGNSCTIEGHSGAGQLKHGPIFRDSMDTHVHDSHDKELKPSDDYSRTKVSTQVEGNSCALEEVQGGAGELKHRPIFKDLMDAHVQDDCDEELKSFDEYSRMKVSPQLEGNRCTLEENQSDAGELKPGPDSMDTHVQDSCDEELKPFDAYSQSKVSFQLEGDSCSLEDRSGAGELKHGPIFKDLMDTHVQDSYVEELKPFNDYSQMKGSTQVKGNKCTLEEDQSGAAELKHGPISEDSMDIHVQDSCDKGSRPVDDYSQTKVSAQVEGNSCTLGEDQSGAGELKHGPIFRDWMDTHGQDSSDEELKPFDDYSQMKVSARVGGNTSNSGGNASNSDNLSTDLDRLGTQRQHLNAFLTPSNEDSISICLSEGQDMFVVDDSTENVANQSEGLGSCTVDPAFRNSAAVKSHADDFSSEKQPSNAESVVIPLGPVEGLDCIKSPGICHEKDRVSDAIQGGCDMVLDDQATSDLKKKGEIRDSIGAIREANFIDRSPYSRDLFKESEDQCFSCQLVQQMQESDQVIDVVTRNKTTDMDKTSEMHIGCSIRCPVAERTLEQIKLAESCSLEGSMEDQNLERSHELFSEQLTSEESVEFGCCKIDNAPGGADLPILPIKQTDQMEPSDGPSSADKISAGVVSCSTEQPEENFGWENIDLATGTELIHHLSGLSPVDILREGIWEKEAIQTASDMREKSNALGTEYNSPTTYTSGNPEPSNRDTDSSGITGCLPKEVLDSGSVELNESIENDECEVSTEKSCVQASYPEFNPCEKKEAQVLRKSLDPKALASRKEESGAPISRNGALSVWDGVQSYEFTALNNDTGVPENDEASTSERSSRPNHEIQRQSDSCTCASEDKDKMMLLNAENDKKTDVCAVKPLPNAVPFSDEWLAAIEAAGEEILTLKTGPVQHSPPEKPGPEPSPWSPVKRKNNQGIGPFDCTKFTNNNLPPPSD